LFIHGDFLRFLAGAVGRINLRHLRCLPQHVVLLTYICTQQVVVQSRITSKVGEGIACPYNCRGFRKQEEWQRTP
jgi:hypothetical protein